MEISICLDEHRIHIKKNKIKSSDSRIWSEFYVSDPLVKQYQLVSIMVSRYWNALRLTQLRSVNVKVNVMRFHLIHFSFSVEYIYIYIYIYVYQNYIYNDNHHHVMLTARSHLTLSLSFSLSLSLSLSLSQSSITSRSSRLHLVSAHRWCM